MTVPPNLLKLADRLAEKVGDPDATLSPSDISAWAELTAFYVDYLDELEPKACAWNLTDEMVDEITRRMDR